MQSSDHSDMEVLKAAEGFLGPDGVELVKTVGFYGEREAWKESKLARCCAEDVIYN